MPLIPLQIAPGIVKNGTEFQQTNSWSDGNLVRWNESAMQPVKGWRKRSLTAMSGVCRKLITYIDNSVPGVRNTLAGTNTHLYAIQSAGQVHNITPANFTTGDADAALNLAWGASTWGSYEFGTLRPDTGNYDFCDTWSIAPWGEYAVACATSDGKIYQWANNVANVATVLSNAPTQCRAICVTDERFVFALGAGSEHDRVEWCDQENNNVWAASSTNQAGGQHLTSSGQLISGHPLRGETLLLTTTDCHVARYTGPPFVYSFQRVGDGCGSVSANGCVVADNLAAWVGLNQFHIYSGGSVTTLKSTVGDYFFSDLNLAQRSKIYGVLNSEYNEIWWFYPSGDSLENNKYVSYNYRDNHWSIGSLARTAGSDAGVFIFPQMVGVDGYVYEHEVGYGYDDAEVYLQSGPIELGNGDQIMKCTSLIPDEKTQGDVTATFKTRLYPNGAETSHGPFTMANPTSVRFQGRQVSMRIDANINTDWRVGTMRLNAVAGGRR